MRIVCATCGMPRPRDNSDVPCPSCGNIGCREVASTDTVIRPKWVKGIINLGQVIVGLAVAYAVMVPIVHLTNRGDGEVASPDAGSKQPQLPPVMPGMYWSDVRGALGQPEAIRHTEDQSRWIYKDYTVVIDRVSGDVIRVDR